MDSISSCDVYFSYTLMPATKDQLERISEEIAACAACRQRGRGHCVTGEGSPNARVVFVGEAPGKIEADIGRPFVGRAGTMLRQQIRLFALSEGDIFLTNAFPYLPKTATPTISDIKHSSTHLQAQLSVIRPQVVVLLGNTAARAALNVSVSSFRVHGTCFATPDSSAIYFVTVHPAAAMRFPKARDIFERDFKKLATLLENPGNRTDEVTRHISLSLTSRNPKTLLHPRYN